MGEKEGWAYLRDTTVYAICPVTLQFQHFLRLGQSCWPRSVPVLHVGNLGQPMPGSNLARRAHTPFSYSLFSVSNLHVLSGVLLAE